MKNCLIPIIIALIYGLFFGFYQLVLLIASVLFVLWILDKINEY